MIKEYIDKWQKNKENVKSWLKETPTDNITYGNLLTKTIDLTINCDEANFNRLDTKRMTEIDNGDYQGTLVFLIPFNRYQPGENEYFVTFVEYGSCSGCDTLQWIESMGEWGAKPNDEQIKSYMLLCLHMLENMKMLYERASDGQKQMLRKLR